MTGKGVNISYISILLPKGWGSYCLGAGPVGTNLTVHDIKYQIVDSNEMCMDIKVGYNS